MIITRLIGGLGNQIFQYAIGKQLAILHKTKLFLDCRDFENYTLRKYALDCFQHTAQIASTELLENFENYPHHLSRIERLWQYRLLGNRNLKVTETNFAYTEGIIKNYGRRQHIYLAGYWQSEKYFKAVEKELRKDLQFFPIDTPLTLQFGKQIKQSTAISLHVRRGDYVSNTMTNQVHGVCSLEYYQKAITFVKEKVGNPTFFVFSDDIAWCKANFTEKNMIFVENLAHDYEDLYLMAACQHHIIANSSFSWWGAWLNPNPNKIVIAPEKWFATQENDYSDVIPVNWTKIL